MAQATESPAGRSPTCEEPELGHLSERIARLYRIWLALVLALLVAGTILDLREDRQMSTETVPLDALPAELGRGTPAALESLALLAVTLGPVASILMIAITCVRRGDRRTAVLALAVLVVVAALPIARSLGGR
ncbi:MAG: hypothetical protein NZL87_06155 [Thermomicrobium sp.]|nr:hypothetical protein [Thermomicrobium sp.]MDW7981227.1 hypothetical protein [Thermomicrobium sp.]